MTDGSRPFPWIAAIVLAAGGSTRMGRSKQLLPVGGQPMVRRTVAAVCAAGLAEVIVVVGAEGTAVSDALAGLPVRIATNEQWAEGLSTSLQTGLRLVQPQAMAALVVLADQPGLSPDLIRVLVDRYADTGAQIVAPYYLAKRGNPVLFDRTLFRELFAVRGDQGGRRVIDRHEREVERVSVDSPAVFIDVDTPGEYDTLEEATSAPDDPATRQRLT